MAEEHNATDIMMLSSSIGSGHMRASAAIVCGVELLDPALTCSVVDFPHEVSPALEHLLRTAYLESLKLWPAAYGKIYRFSDGARSGPYRRYVEGFGLRTLKHLVSNTGARALVATHFYGAAVLGSYKEQNPQAFAAVVLTDYVPHPIGVPSSLDLYVVADETAAEIVARLGVPEEKIRSSGIPIDPLFEEPVDVVKVRRDLLKVGEDDLPVVLVMGGGLGGSHLEEAVSLLFEASTAMHLVVLCGSNERAHQRLEELAKKRGYRVTLLTFTDRIRDLMAVGSVLVTKPGGMTCTEALASQLPQVLYHPIPGQEEGNAAAMLRYGAGIVVRETEEILGETLRILTSPNHRNQMTECAWAAHRPHSARSAAELILGGLP